MYTTITGGTNVNATLSTAGSGWNRLSIKKGVKQLIVVCFFLCCGLIQQSWAQSVTWNLTSSFTPNICGSGLTATAPTSGSAITVTTSTPSTTSGYAGTGFPTSSTAPTASTSVTRTNYQQFSFTNTSGSTITIGSENITTYYNYSSGLYERTDLWYSTNGFASGSGTQIGTSYIQTNTGTTNTGSYTTSISVPTGTTITIRVFNFYDDATTATCGILYLSLGVAPTAPTGFAAAAGNGQNVLTSTSTSTALLAWNTSNTFGTPANGTVYTAGNSISGGGTVLYNAASGSNFYTHTGLTNGTPIYYSLWNVGSGSCTYSTAVTANATPIAPCTTPSAQPTTLTLSNPIATTVSGSFTASGSANSYLVVRSTSSSASGTNPANGTAYNVGGTLATGYTVVSTGSSTSFTDNGLTASTHYYYWVYAYNATTCSGGPLYYTTSPLSNNITTSSVKTWVGAGSSLSATGTDFNLAANWSPAVSPTTGDNLVMSLVYANTAPVITFASGSTSVTVNSLTITYSGAFTATQTGSITIPGTYSLTTTGNVSISNSATSKAGTFNFTVASGGALNVGGNLSITNTGSVANKITLSNSNTLTVTGTTTAINTCSLTTGILKFHTLTGGTTTFTGNATFDDNTSTSYVNLGSGSSSAGGTFIFRGNLNLGLWAGGGYYSGSVSYLNTCTLIFDANGSQTINDNMYYDYYNNTYYWTPMTFQVGQTYSPTVTIVKGAGGYSNTLLKPYTNLTVNGSSVLIVPSTETLDNFYYYNNASTSGSFTLNSTATIKIAGTTDELTLGSSFPSGYTTTTLASGSTVEYNGTATQTVYATPTYGNLIIGDASSTPASTGTVGTSTVTVATGSTIISGATLIGTGTVSGPIDVKGTISPNTSGTNGTLTTGNLTLDAGGTYYVDINNVTGTAGTNWDKLVAGTLTNSATSGSKFTFSVNGTITGFSNTTSTSWIVGTYTGTAPSTSNIVFTATGTLSSYVANLSVSFASNNITITYGVPPTVTTTTPPSPITATAATMGGNVTATGGAAITGNGIVYSATATNAAPVIGGTGVTQLATSGAGTGTGTFSDATSVSLSPNTQYSYAAYATNNINTAYGSTNTFYTLGNNPTAPVVSSPTTTSLNVAIGSGDGNPSVTTYAIQETTTGLYVQSTSGALGASAVYNTASAWGTATVTGLSSNVGYVFAAYAKNVSGTVSGIGTSSATAYTLAATPTAPVVNGATTSSLNVAIGNGDGNSVATTYAIYVTTTGQYVQSNGSLGSTAVYLTATAWSTTTVTGLTATTAYTFEVKGKNGAGTTTAYGPTTTVSTTSNSTPACPNYNTLSPNSSQTICQNVTAGTLTANITTTGTAGTPTLQYQWYYNSSNSNIISGATSISGETNNTFIPPTTGSEGSRYYFCVGYATDNTCNQTNTTQSLATTSPILVTVNTPPTYSGVSASSAVLCSGSSATITLTGLMNVAQTISYTIGGTSGTQTASVTGSGGSASFNTIALTAANSGQTITITGIARTDVSPNCSISPVSSNTASLPTVYTLPTLTSTSTGSTSLCSNGTATITLNGILNVLQTVSYTVGGTSGTQTASVTGSGGTGSFSTIALGTANSGKTITITSINITGTSGCPLTPVSNNTATLPTVNVNPTVTTATASPATVCSGATVTLNATSIAAVSGNATIGTGTDVTTLTTDGTPYRVGNTVGYDFKNQYLILGTELQAAGLQAGNLTSLKLYVAGAGGGTLSNLTIKLGTTGLNALTTTYITGLTQVYTISKWPATGTLTTGLQTHTFNTPYNWDGSSNIVVEVCATLATGGTAGTLEGVATSFVSTIANNPATGACSSASGGGTYSVRPNIILVGQVGTNVTSNYNWTWSTTGAGGTNVATGGTNNGATGATATPTNSGGSPTSVTYTAIATNASTGCSGNLAILSAITVNPYPTAPTNNSTAVAQCGSQAIFKATSSASSPTYNFYTAATGG